MTKGGSTTKGKRLSLTGGVFSVLSQDVKSTKQPSSSLSFLGSGCVKKNFSISPSALADTCSDDEQKKEDARALRRLEYCAYKLMLLFRKRLLFLPLSVVSKTLALVLPLSRLVLQVPVFGLMGAQIILPAPSLMELGLLLLVVTEASLRQFLVTSISKAWL